MALTSISFHELIFIFGILGNIVSFGVYLAPLPTFWSIYKKNSTQGFQAIPYSVALFSAMLLLYYAFLKTDNATLIITINSVGVLIEGSYLVVFLYFAPKKAKVFTAKLIGLFNVTFLGLIIVATLVFACGEDAHKFLSRGGMRETTVGWICAVFSVCVFAAPLSVMRMVIRTKSVEFMPFWLSFSLTLCAVMWFFYGLLIKDFYIALPNVLGFLFGITQMILYIIYKDSSNKQKNMVINEADIMQFQAELAVDIKLDKIEKIGSEDNETVRLEAVKIIVDEITEKAEEEEANNNINAKVVNVDENVKNLCNTNNIMAIDNKEAVGDPPRGKLGV